MSKQPVEILLIEDNQGDVGTIQNALSDQKVPFRLHVLGRGETALDFLYRRSKFAFSPTPDLIFLDLNLPGQSGIETLEIIKSDSSLRQIPLVVLTSSQSELDIKKSYDLGASCFIVKPVDMTAFSELVRQVMSFWLGVVQLPPYSTTEKDLTAAQDINAATKKYQWDQSLQVLFVEDCDADFEGIAQMLHELSSPRFTVSRALRLQEAFEHLNSEPIDVVLLDLSLPDSRGIETVQKFHARVPRIPFVVLTGAEDEAQGLLAVTEGAESYLEKSQIQKMFLVRTLLHAIDRKAALLSLEAALASEYAARTEAEKAIAVRDDFLSIASHELRSPLALVRMQVQLLTDFLKRGQRDEMFAGLLKNLAEKTDGHMDHYSKLVDRLLDFSYIQSGRLQLNISEFDLSEVLTKTVAQFTNDLKKAECAIVLDAGTPIQGSWDYLRIEQVVSNLISNAVKYSSGKPIEVSVTSTQDSVCIQIKDQGTGIAAEDRERIFKRFERVALKKSITGFGIGLYVVRQIVDLHGGKILLESELGKGSTFSVHLPRWSVQSVVQNLPPNGH
jgi:signal transduction histidine kinase